MSSSVPRRPGSTRVTPAGHTPWEPSFCTCSALISVLRRTWREPRWSKSTRFCEWTNRCPSCQVFPFPFRGTARGAFFSSTPVSRPGVTSQNASSSTAKARVGRSSAAGTHALCMSAQCWLQSIREFLDGRREERDIRNISSDAAPVTAFKRSRAQATAFVTGEDEKNLRRRENLLMVCGKDFSKAVKLYKAAEAEFQRELKGVDPSRGHGSKVHIPSLCSLRSVALRLVASRIAAGCALSCRCREVVDHCDHSLCGPTRLRMHRSGWRTWCRKAAQFALHAPPSGSLRITTQLVLSATDGHGASVPPLPTTEVD